MMVNGTFAYPAYATVTPQNAAILVNNATSTEGRAPYTSSAATQRTVAAWSTNTSFDLNVAFSDGQSHQVALYLMDWNNGNREQTVSVLDASTLAVLDTRSLTQFGNGQYLVWNITGPVKIRVTLTSGISGIANAIFFDPASVVVSPRTLTLAAGQQQQFQAKWGSLIPQSTGVWFRPLAPSPRRDSTLRPAAF